MKPVWNGSISFGLVNIPIKLFSAVSSKSFSFKLLHEKDKSPIGYKKWCKEEDREISNDEIVKAVEISKGNYHLMDKEELDRIKPEKSDFLDIIEFVDGSQVDPIYFSNHYFIGPQKSKDKSYFLFKEVLGLSGKVAIGRFVMREKEYVCMIRSFKKGLLLSTLNYAYEIRDINDLDELGDVPELRDEELGLANELINRLYKDEFDISKFEDTFAQKLQEALEKKEVIVYNRKEIEPPKENLMKALKASIKESGNKKK